MNLCASVFLVIFLRQFYRNHIHFRFAGFIQVNVGATVRLCLLNARTLSEYTQSTWTRYTLRNILRVRCYVNERLVFRIEWNKRRRTTKNSTQRKSCSEMSSIRSCIFTIDFDRNLSYSQVDQIFDFLILNQ